MNHEIKLQIAIKLSHNYTDTLVMCGVIDEDQGCFLFDNMVEMLMNNTTLLEALIPNVVIPEDSELILDEISNVAGEVVYDSGN